MGHDGGRRFSVGELSELHAASKTSSANGSNLNGAPQGGSDAMCYVQNSLACYVLCRFLFTLLCEIKIGCYAEV